MKDNTVLLKEQTEQILELMGTPANVSVKENKDSESLEVDIEEGDATGLLIGKKGETLASLQTILGVMLKVKTGEWIRVLVNVGDYKEKEEDYLKSLAKTAAERAMTTKTPQNLYNLKSWQRRVVHMYLKDNFPDLQSESTGEGDERCLVIVPKN